MPHFGDALKDFNRLLQWADLRLEQGVNVNGRIARLQRQFQAMSRELEKRGPSKAIAANEPNDLASIRALRPASRRKIWRRFDAAEYSRRVEGAWLAREAGCTLGAIVEHWTIERMEKQAAFCKMDFPPTDYWTRTDAPLDIRYLLSRRVDYTRGGIKHVPVDDDLAYTVLGLLILEEFGPDFSTDDVGKAWLRYVPMAYTAEKVALQNLKRGVPARQAGVKGNPFMELLGADIRSDPWGYAAPGWPEKAAEMAYRDAYLSHRYSGIYGAMYFSAVIAAAFAVDETLEACRIGLGEIPRSCRLYGDLAWALKQAPKVRDYRHGRELVDRRFPGTHHAHTHSNASMTIFGLALGGRDVTKVIGNTVAMGIDNDCTAATAGSIVGAVVGAENVPEHWYKPFRNKVRMYLTGREWYTNTDIVRRFARIASKVWGC